MSQQFSQRIRFFREQSKLSVAETARRLGVAVSTYREWEYGRKMIGSQIYPQLALVFNVSLPELFGVVEPGSGIIADLNAMNLIIKRIRLKL